jgi:hypothetical protein
MPWRAPKRPGQFEARRGIQGLGKPSYLADNALAVAAAWLAAVSSIGLTAGA